MTVAETHALQLPTELALALTTGRCSTPHACLGAHASEIAGRQGVIVRALHPEAVAAWAIPLDSRGEAFGEPVAMTMLDAPSCFGVFIADARVPLSYRIRFRFRDGSTHERGDPYRHWPTLGDHDLHLFNEGQHFALWRVLGAHPRVHEGDAGVAFAVWAPNAERVSVVGDFCGWDGRVFPMRALGSSGVFELFVPGVEQGALYQFEVRTRDGSLHMKADPFANQCERPPGRACRVVDDGAYRWRDHEWMGAREHLDIRRAPMHVYEVHLGSWRRHADGTQLSYRELALPLVHHALHFSYTHIELLPICEHPFEGSWGYQVTGFYAPTSRFGTPDDFRYLVDVCHAHGIGVIMDWVPAHFPRDAFALARFDGTALYEHPDPLRGEHPDWGTYIFNYGRHEVRNFLIASALYWLREMHIDGLRVDAVASMLYRDYGRGAGQWVPNEQGGREDLEAVAFIRGLHVAIREHARGCFTIAEESTSWQGVTASLEQGGLGFTFKWNMGWMHDTLRYFARDAIHRRHHQDDLTFAILYEHTEHFMNALSHDEVVHEKRSLLGKMAGDPWQQLANLRALLGYQMFRPGKKLAFMGTEIAVAGEWDHNAALPLVDAGDRARQGFQRFVAELGACYRAYPCLWNSAPEVASFRWIDTKDHGQSVLSFSRQDDRALLVVVLNLTPIPRRDYRIGAPRPGRYRTLINSDDARFGGSGTVTTIEHVTAPIGMHGLADSLSLELPPLSALVLEAVRDADHERLHDAAAEHGVFNDYYTTEGARHVTVDATRRALLQAMSMAHDELSPQQAALPATRVEEQGSLALGLIRVTTPRPDIARVSCALDVRSDGRDLWSDALEYVAPARHAYLRASRLEQLPVGCHALSLELTWHGLDGSTQQSRATQTLIVAPSRSTLRGDVMPAARRDTQALGLWLALYALRSERGWGSGDLSDLKQLVAWAGAQGLDFIGINPLHAAVLPCHPLSPYFPTTRLYRCELYLDVEAIPELSDCVEAQRLIASSSFQAQRAALVRAPAVDYRAVHALKWPVIVLLARHFVAQEKGDDRERPRAYERYCRAHHDTLHAYATFRVLADVHGAASFEQWPMEHRDPKSQAVAAFAAAHAQAIETHMFVQFELDRQLADVTRAARQAGMAIGLYLDLAVGSQHGGFDTWLRRDLFATGVNLGAPPDALGPDGQDWGLCPLIAGAQQRDGYRFARTLLRHNMQHAGALRIDHVLGLARQYWVPHAPATPGTYVAFPLHEWLAVIAIESVQHRCLVIGEDLGTVPEGLRDALASHGLYGCRVLHFSIDGADDPDRRTAVLASLNSHDLPPFAGFVHAEDIALRQQLGLLAPERARQAQVERRRRVAGWVARLKQEGLLDADVPDDDVPALLAATHRALQQTGAELVAVSLEDLVGEVTPLNVPGVTGTAAYQPWTRRMQRSVESIVHDAGLLAVVRALRPASYVCERTPRVESGTGSTPG